MAKIDTVHVVAVLVVGRDEHGWDNAVVRHDLRQEVVASRDDG